MPRDKKSVELLKLFHLLSYSRRNWRVAELAAESGLGKRTVYRYLPELTEYLDLRDDEKGTYWVEPSSFMPKLNLTRTELTTTLLCLNVVGDRFLRQQMEGVVNKLRSGLGDTRQEFLERLAERVAGPTVSEVSAAPDMLAVLGEAISHHRRLRVEYHSRERDQAVERLLDPIGMWHYGGAWYFQAFDHLTNTRRCFRTSRVRSLQTNGETFSPHDFSAEEATYVPWDPPDSGKPVKVVIELPDNLGRWLAETPVHLTQHLEECPAGCRLTVRVGAPHKMVGWVAGLTGARVLEPASLRRAVGDHLRAALALHD